MNDPVSGTAAAAHLSPLTLFLNADSVVKAVAILLLLASVAVWAILFDKLALLARLNKRAAKVLASYRDAAGKEQVITGFTAHLPDHRKDPFRAVYTAMAGEVEQSRRLHLDAGADHQDTLRERVQRIAQLTAGAELDRLRGGLSLLATIGSVGPFVGLFGTVWGIMNSFEGIAASNNTSLAVVAPGIAEALAATALGLVAAIPAVIAYNAISGHIGRYGKKLNTFIGAYEVDLSRALSQKGGRDGRLAA